MNKLPISVGILSWNSKTTVRNTLESYKRNGLLDMVSDVTIFFQEYSADDVLLANEYGIKHFDYPTNIGIGHAFVTLAQAAQERNILLLEHDWELIENAEVTHQRLQEALNFLRRGFASVRLRHRKQPGHPLYSIPAYRGNELNHYCPVTKKMSPHLLDCIHWIENPHEQFPDKIQKEGDYFISTSRWSTWTNNPCLFDKYFYLLTVQGFLTPGDLALEPSISGWWADQDFKVAYGEGLFKHNDLEKIW